MVYQTFCAAYQASPTAVYRPAKHLYPITAAPINEALCPFGTEGENSRYHLWFVRSLTGADLTLCRHTAHAITGGPVRAYWANCRWGGDSEGYSPPRPSPLSTKQGFSVQELRGLLVLVTVNLDV